jgi:hypothetical protein
VAGRLHIVVIHAATTPETLVFARSYVVLLYRADGPWICYHIINKYLYAGSYDIESYEQAL